MKIKDVDQFLATLDSCPTDVKVKLRSVYKDVKDSALGRFLELRLFLPSEWVVTCEEDFLGLCCLFEQQTSRNGAIKKIILG